MDVRNCRKCGRLFNYAMGPIICQQCKEGLEEKFQEVKKYVYEHPGCGISEVSEECEVEAKQIKQWLREERLQFSEDSTVMLNCETCGAPIRSGRFCEKCKNSMVQTLGNTYKKEMPKEEPKKKNDNHEKPRMHYLDR